MSCQGLVDTPRRGRMDKPYQVWVDTLSPGPVGTPQQDQGDTLHQGSEDTPRRRGPGDTPRQGQVDMLGRGLMRTLPRGWAGMPGPQPEGQEASCSSLPFRSPVEVEMARQSLAPSTQPYQGPVRKELVVSSSVLAIRLTAEDPGQLRVSSTSCLNWLSLLVWTVQRFVPQFFTKPGPGKGASD
ncbi:cancer/testis antigen 1-like [Phacochoerus africanus]|uniref:cancer/testis antigen 1-like n=1 Tax=Phacochoerus africanus TaxID=41426 RepID=UPI001FDA9C20|nr:cancer/testis antigen 1-like [Phacochoerus africanus]